mmetsp:Transcript_31891/g.44624  ORF Transcript_31891/g.44624 Transcript_31891/m.44624 type:complete len:221 (+) Transcript_31891:64-726(+)
MSNEARKEAMREQRSVESQNALNRRQAVKMAIKLSNKVMKEAKREAKAIESQNEFNKRKSQQKAIELAEEEQLRRIREISSAKSLADHESRKAKKAVKSATKEERIRQMMEDFAGGTLAISLATKPATGVVVEYCGKKLVEAKGEGGQFKISFNEFKGKTTDPITFKAFNSTLSMDLEELVSLPANTKQKMGFKKYLTFVNVSASYPKKTSSLAKIIAQK